MENNDSNIKSPQTGGLKLMTVFVFVIAAHVVVIGGMCGYYLLKGGTSDADLLTDKINKTVKAMPDGALATDGQMPETGDKSTPAPMPTPATPLDASATAASPAPATTTDQTASPEMVGTPNVPTTSTTQSVTTTTTTPVPAVTPTPAPVTTPVATTTVANTEPTPASVQPAPVINPPVTIAPTTPVVADAAPTTDGTPYVVKVNDSLAKIAKQNHLTVTKLKAANSMTSNLLHVGQSLVIPGKAQTAATSVATASPTVNAPAMTPVRTASTTSESSHHSYTVVKGDTLTKIAHKFKTTATALMTANNITDPTKLSIGKKLKIPSKDSRSAKNSEPATSQPTQIQAKTTGSTAELANITQ